MKRWATFKMKKITFILTIIILTFSCSKNRKSNNPKLKFKYLSKFPKGKDLWNKNYDFLYHGSLHFTKIIFDKTNHYGLLNIGIAQGRLNGYGCRVFIKVNEQNKWVIDKIENTWVS